MSKINGNVYEGRMSKTEFDTNADAPEYQDVQVRITNQWIQMQ